jgi:hypothetical protein
MPVNTLVVNLTREETIARLERIGTFINRETGDQDEQSYVPISQETILDRQREHWRKLHEQQLYETTFEEWVASIPGCFTCQHDFRKLLEINPPRFDDWQRWTWEAHNAVNAKLGKPEIDWNQACNLWNWNPQKDFTKGTTTEST